MSRALQKAIVYELFALFLAVVICAVALAESLTAGYLTGPWIALAVPALIALYGFLKALGASGDGVASDERTGGPTTGGGADGAGGDDGEETDDERPVAAAMGHPPY